MICITGELKDKLKINQVAVCITEDNLRVFRSEQGLFEINGVGQTHEFKGELYKDKHWYIEENTELKIATENELAITKEIETTKQIKIFAIAITIAWVILVGGCTAINI